MIRLVVLLVLSLSYVSVGNALEICEGSVKLNVEEAEKGIRVKGELSGDYIGPWVLPGYSFSGEQDDPVAIVKEKERYKALVAGYSGGAHCCWDVFAYDLSNRKKLGEVIASRSSINFIKKEGKNGVFFEVRVVGEGFDEWNAPYVTYNYVYDGLVIDKSNKSVEKYMLQVSKAIEAYEKIGWTCEDVRKRSDYFKKVIGENDEYEKILKEVDKVCPL